MPTPIKSKRNQLLEEGAQDITKGDFEHYTLKEINEQPQTIRNASLAAYPEEYGTAIFDELNFDNDELLSVPSGF